MAIQGAEKSGNQVNPGATGGSSLGGLLRLGDAPPDFAGVAAEMFKGLMAMFSPQKVDEKSTPVSATKDEIAKARAEGKAEAEDDAAKKAKGPEKVAEAPPRVLGTPALPLPDNAVFVSHAGTGLKVAD